jgi:hypothetical protein
MTARRRGRSRWQVHVQSPKGPDRAATTLTNDVATVHRAFERVCDVLAQWAASEGAITPGTRISIVDRNDGGQLFVAEYLGYDNTLPTGGSQQWQRLSEPKTPKTWPR